MNIDSKILERYFSHIARWLDGLSKLTNINANKIKYLKLKGISFFSFKIRRYKKKERKLRENITNM